MQREKRDLGNEFREWAKENGYFNQTTAGAKAICLYRWIYDNIDDIIIDSRYAELSRLYTYYGIPRDRAIAIFDYVNAGASFDWKTQEIDPYATFIIRTYISDDQKGDLTKVGGKGDFVYSDFTIDTILALHMEEFVDIFPWDSFPHPTPMQLDLIVETYRNHDISRSDSKEDPTGGLWEWILPYGERTPIPTSVILRAMEDVLASTNPGILAETITREFLQMQPLVREDGNDDDLCKVWDCILTSLESNTGYPTALIGAYDTDDRHVNFDELYRKIYEDILSTQKERIARMRNLLNNVNNNPEVFRDNWDMLALYRTSVRNNALHKEEVARCAIL
ncbi:MAG: hypothetical protein NC548_29695 [Lachnospiraceae bacterium]|nr:hypothetical protein [Lachnospiraceae bacterium]